MEATWSRHGWVHMFITHWPTVTLQLHNFVLIRTCRTKLSSFCIVAWQFCTRPQQVGLLQQSPDWLASHSHPAPPVSPKCRSKAHFQPQTLWPHHRRAHKSSLAPRAGANYIQGGDTDVSCTACFRTTLLGVVIHMCRRHAAPTQAQFRLHWTAWRFDLSSVNYRRSCLSCCWSKGVEWPAKRCYVGSSLSVFKNRLKTYLFRRCYETVWL